MADAPFIELDELVARIPDGCRLAVPKDSAGCAMEATRALIRRGAKDLHLITLPAGGVQTDLLIGAGCVATLETSAVSLSEFGLAPRFREAVQDGEIAIMDATCPALYAALQAGEKGIPFMPLRGLIGSDVLAHRSDWKVIDNPLADSGDPMVILPAITPDVALFHARLGDRYGNVWVGNRRECVLLAHAAKSALATVEEFYDGNLMTDDKLVAGTIPPVYVDAVALAPKGAWPLGLLGCYDTDADHLKDYAKAARTREGFDDYLARHVMDTRVLA